MLSAVSGTLTAACLDEAALFALAHGRLAAAERERAQRHLADCQRCATAVADVLRERAPEPAAIGPGTLIDRFIMLQRVGAGAMGQVFVAHDPKLDRKVALKLLSSEAAAGGDVAMRTARLWREAQALARLTHKNLVGVFDVLSHGEQLVIAMEYVPGHNLHQWLSEQQRPWRDVLRVFVDAGRGLAAAHDAGLVHRDFKPENVLLSPTGEAKVTDFGLARLVSDAEDEGPALAEELASPMSADLTRTGAMLGTPAYMAPELFTSARPASEASTLASAVTTGEGLGSPGTAKSDQFSFCVSLYEGLYGQRPFGRTPLRALLKGAPRPLLPPPPGRSIPSWLRRVVLRGLSADPAARYPSMHELLVELGRDPGRTRVRVAAGAFGVALLGLGVVLARPPMPCRDPSLRIEWNDAKREAMRAAFMRSGAPDAASAAARVDAQLTTWTHGWAENLDKVCADLSPRGPPPPSLFLTMACLLGLAVDFRAEVDALSSADPAVVALADHAAAALAPMSRCQSMREVRPVDSEKPALTKRATPLLRLRIAQLAALGDEGRVDEALALASGVLGDARAEGVPEAESDTLGLMERWARARGDFEGAERAARTAVRSSVLIRGGGAFAHGWSRLAVALTLRAEREPNAALLVEQADDAAQLALASSRSPVTSPALEVDVASALAAVALAKGNTDDALSLAASVATRTRALWPAGSPEVEEAVDRLASVYRRRGDAANARPLLQELAGARHLRTPFEAGRLAEGLAWAAWRLGDLATARERSAAAQTLLMQAGAPGVFELDRLRAWRATLEP